MTLTDKIANIIPDWIKIKIFELEEDEELFLSVEKENRRRVWCLGLPKPENRMECEQMGNTMKFLLDKYGNGRFSKYFQAKMDSFDFDVKKVLRYH